VERINEIWEEEEEDGKTKIKGLALSLRGGLEVGRTCDF
jgi:hypothetical protein